MDTAFDQQKEIIQKKIIYNNVLILTSDTGLGKTTRVPLYMIELFTLKGLNHEYKIKKQGNDEYYSSNPENYSFSFILNLPLNFSPNSSFSSFFCSSNDSFLFFSLNCGYNSSNLCSPAFVPKS